MSVSFPEQRQEEEEEEEEWAEVEVEKLTTGSIGLLSSS